MFRCSYCKYLIISEEFQLEYPIDEPSSRTLSICWRCLRTFKKSLLFLSAMLKVGDSWPLASKKAAKPIMGEVALVFFRFAMVALGFVVGSYMLTGNWFPVKSDSQIKANPIWRFTE